MLLFSVRNMSISHYYVASMMGVDMDSEQSISFPLGRVMATPGALNLMDQASVGVLALLSRHQSGDWGDVDGEDWQANQEALEHGWRLLSSYAVGEGKVWIITEADRSATTLLLQEEY